MIRLVPALLLLAAAGCTAPVTYLEEDSSAPVERVVLPVPLRLGVESYMGDHDALFNQALKALRQDINFDSVKVIRPGSRPSGLDYVVALDFALEGDARFHNLFTAFPGFIIFAQHWIGLHWELAVTSDLRITTPRDGLEAARLTRTDVFRLKDTPSGLSMAINAGWAGLLFPPAAVAPLIAGFAAAFMDGHALELAPRVMSSRHGWDWAKRIGHMIALTAHADLQPGPEAGAPAGGGEPEPAGAAEAPVAADGASGEDPLAPAGQ